MSPDRRHASLALTALAVAACTGTGASKEQRMFGLIGKLVAKSGERERLASVLLEGSTSMPGCLSYVVAHDAKEPDAIWVTEVWQSEEFHRQSLALPAVKAAIARGRPLIASFGSFTATQPVGGVGLGGPGAA